MNEEQLRLKISAMKEALASSIGNYEERVADLRVQLTIMGQERDLAIKENKESAERVTALEARISEYEREQNGETETAADDAGS